MACGDFQRFMMKISWEHGEIRIFQWWSWLSHHHQNDLLTFDHWWPDGSGSSTSWREVKQKFLNLHLPTTPSIRLLIKRSSGKYLNVKSKCQISIRKWNGPITNIRRPTHRLYQFAISFTSSTAQGYQKFRNTVFRDHNSLLGQKLFDKVFFNFWP